MRLLICAGGTGGGVYPALAVLQAVRADFGECSENEVHSQKPTLSAIGIEQNAVQWVGSERGMEADLVKRAGVPFEAIPASGVHGVGVRALPRNLSQLEKGYRRSKRILGEFQPDVLFFTGGYISVPMALAGRKKRSLLFVPDIEPGLALRTIARFADSIALSTEDSREYFERHSGLSVTGYPTRSNLRGWSIKDARKALNLEPDLPTLLVFGGSKGARSINCALLSVLPELLPEMQIVHISGEFDWDEVQSAREKLETSSAYGGRYHAYPYLHSKMGAALTVADLVVSRAGASSLGEFPLFGLPAILVPYPHAWRYQQTNAQYLSKRGAALVLQDSDLRVRLSKLVRKLMNDQESRNRMSQAMRSLAYPEAAASIATLLIKLATTQSPERN